MEVVLVGDKHLSLPLTVHQSNRVVVVVVVVVVMSKQSYQHRL